MAKQQRQLGMLEKNQIAKQLTKGYASVTLTAIVNHPPRPIATNPASFYIQQFQPALQRMLAQHPMLRLTVADVEKPSAHFVQLDRFLMDDLVFITENHEFWEKPCLERIIREECQHHFDLFASVPLWRLRVSCHAQQLDSCCVTLTLQHVIMDGLSTLVFWKDLLQHLNDTNDQKDASGVIDLDPVVNVPLPFELRGCPIVELGPYSDFIPENGWQGDFAARENEELDTVVHIDHFGGDALATLVKRAKIEYVSVHSAIYAAYLLAWASRYQGRSVKTATAINCRPFCVPPVGDELGIFFGRYECGWDEITLALHAENDLASFWDLAREYHTRLQAKKQETCQRTLLTDSLLPTYPESYCNVWTSARKKFSMGRSGGLNISDLGRFDVDQEGKAWTMTETWFCQSAHSFATVIALNVITTCGQLDVAFTWQQGSVVDHTAKDVIRSFMRILSSQATTV
ncbi:hypothetical protein BC940DRAFT_317049 [Gongronella butleri]|nr:hypothetical protein BC940DRAFT_317049 [Gongronella butleri]